MWIRLPQSLRFRNAATAVALAVLTCGAAVTAPSAHASCGDYLVVGVQADAPAALAAHRGRSPASHYLPFDAQPLKCDGPNCSSRDPASGMPLSGELTVTPKEQAAQRSGDAMAKRSRRALAWIGSEHLPPAEHFSRIFRPPR